MRAALTRRNLLKSTALATALAPFIPILEAEAQAAMPKRLVFFFSTEGTIHEKWLPTVQGDQLVLPEILAPLESYKEQLTVVDGLGYDIPGWTGHNVGVVLTGSAPKPFNNGGQVATDISVDQHIANTLCEGLKFRSLELGIQVDDYSYEVSAVSYRSGSDPIRPSSDVYAIYERVFGGLTVGNVGVPDVDPRLLDRQSVLDFVSSELESLKPKISANDRFKLEGHLASVRQLELSLTTGAGQSATASCGPKGYAQKLDPWSNDNIPALGRFAIDSLVMALACDLTRVATVQYGRGGANHRFTWLGSEFSNEADGANDGTTGIHGLGHNEANPNARAKLVKCHAWFAGELAYLMSKLQAIPEGNGTMADNTLVVWINEMGTGNHSLKNVPLALIGNAGGAIKPGRVLSFPDQPHNKLLATLCQVMGLPSESFGHPDFKGSLNLA